jgi:hypothetical protein
LGHASDNPEISFYFWLDPKVTKGQGFRFFPCFSHPRNAHETQALLSGTEFIFFGARYYLSFYLNLLPIQGFLLWPALHCCGGKTTGKNPRPVRSSHCEVIDNFLNTKNPRKTSASI